VDELTLTDRIALSDPADLAFADGMHCLVALNRSACTLRRAIAYCREQTGPRFPIVLRQTVFHADQRVGVHHPPGILSIIPALDRTARPKGSRWRKFRLVEEGGGPIKEIL
jgi:hypothetical protein